jgi:hypothetical protein
MVPEGEALPPYLRRARTDVPGMLWHWYASIGKNTAHAVGDFAATQLWQWPTERLVYVNMDADNTLMHEYLPEVVARFAAHTWRPGTVVQAAGTCSTGTTGRLAYLRRDFEYPRT